MPEQREGERNYIELAAELRIVREMLKALESAIAAIDCAGHSGFTKPGLYMYELLASMRVHTQEDLQKLILKLDEAADLVADEALESGRR